MEKWLLNLLNHYLLASDHHWGGHVLVEHRARRKTRERRLAKPCFFPRRKSSFRDDLKPTTQRIIGKEDDFCFILWVHIRGSPAYFIWYRRGWWGFPRAHHLIILTGLPVIRSHLNFVACETPAQAFVLLSEALAKEAIFLNVPLGTMNPPAFRSWERQRTWPLNYWKLREK